MRIRLSWPKDGRTTDRHSRCFGRNEHAALNHTSIIRSPVDIEKSSNRGCSAVERPGSVQRERGLRRAIRTFNATMALMVLNPRRGRSKPFSWGHVGRQPMFLHDVRSERHALEPLLQLYNLEGCPLRPMILMLALFDYPRLGYDIADVVATKMHARSFPACHCRCLSDTAALVHTEMFSLCG